MPTDRLYKLESSVREEYWVPDPVIFIGGTTNPETPSGTGFWGNTPPPSWGSSGSGFPPPPPKGGSGGGGSGGSSGDNDGYTDGGYKGTHYSSEHDHDGVMDLSPFAINY